MTDEPEFKILHLSARHKQTDKIPYIIFNIIFKVLPTDEPYPWLKNCVESAVEDSCKIFGHLTKEDFDLWCDSSSKFNHKKVEVYVMNGMVNPLHEFIQYIPKFDCYQFREYFDDTPATRGLIQHLMDMKEGKPNRSRATAACQFTRTLTALTNFWD